MPPAAAPQVEHNYEIEELLGKGPLSESFQARHKRTGRPCRLKRIGNVAGIPDEIYQAYVERLADEVQKNASLDHPNICGVLDCYMDGEQPTIVYELCVGGNLEQHTADIRASKAQYLPLLQALVEALAYAHGAGVLHLAIKPHNILFDQRGKVKLTDFGYSPLKELVGASPDTMVPLGALRYASPQQLRHPAAATPSDDLFSLGVTFYELITGQAQGPEMSSEASGELPKALGEIVGKLRAERREDRYQSAQELAAELGVVPSSPTLETPAARPAGTGEADLASVIAPNPRFALQCFPQLWAAQPEIAAQALLAFVRQAETEQLDDVSQILGGLTSTKTEAWRDALANNGSARARGLNFLIHELRSEFWRDMVRAMRQP